jgi:CRP-like cAMP-binding protein
MIEQANRVGFRLPATPPGSELPSELSAEQRVEHGFYFGRQHEPCLRLYFVVSGHVSLRQTRPEGTDRLHEFLGPGDVFGEEALIPEGKWRVSALAITPVRVSSVLARNLPRFGRHYSHWVSDVCTQLSVRLERTYRRMDLLHSSSTQERVYCLLTDLARQYGQLHEHRVWLSLPLTQSDLADLARMRRETMARALGNLEAEGLIQRRGRRGFWLSCLS